MNIFLSASVPQVGRGNFYENADPFLIQVAVRELVTTIARSGTLVWGGHPSITPMIWAVCEDLGVKYEEHVRLYQSLMFEAHFPEENKQFGNVTHVQHVEGDIAASLRKMRERMLTDTHVDAAVFVGGMEGIFDEFAMVSELQPHAKRIVLTAPGGAAQQLGARIRDADIEFGFVSDTVDFAEHFEGFFPSPPRNKPDRRMKP